MIDLKTGRFILREGVELYPGMTRDDFFKSSLYKTQLFRESDKENTRKRSYDLKVQEIDGFQMQMCIYLSNDDEYGDYINEIEMTKPEFYDWPDGWPSDWNDYAYSIKKYNDEFLQKQIQGNIREGKELWFDYEWGSITSSISLMHTPRVMLTIRFHITSFKEAKGKKYNHSYLKGFIGE